MAALKARSPPMSASSFLATSSRRGESFAALMPASVRLRALVVIVFSMNAARRTSAYRLALADL